MFAYKGRSTGGNPVSGQIEATSPESAAGFLLERGISPIYIGEAEESESMSMGKMLGRLSRRRPKLDEMIMFNRQMYTLTRAGIPLNRAMNGLIDTARNPMLVSALADIVGALDAGYELSSAMAQHPKVFPYLMVSMVRVGETTGQLEDAFYRIAAMLQHEKDTRDRIKSAVRYPIFVVVAIVIAVIILNIWVIPSFASVFTRFGADLPLATQLIIGTSNFTVSYWPYLLVAIIGAAVALRNYIKGTTGAYKWGRFKLRIPVIGSIIHRASLARFARTFASATKAGIPVVQTLNIIISSEENPYIAQRVNQMRDNVERGDTLLRSATICGLFTPVVLQMISVGEESGALDSMLHEVAGFYEREVDYELKNLSSTIEPILITIIAGIVLVLALGIFLPMWDLSSAAIHN
jgi:MSHA biogenesis protein MshG